MVRILMALHLDPMEQMLEELLDPVFFLESFARLNTADGQIPWRGHMDNYQKYILRDISRFRIVNKSKKTGISTTMAGEAIHRTFTHKDIDEILVATGERVAAELLKKASAILQSFPPNIVPMGILENQERIQLPNNSRIACLPSMNPSKIRGYGMKGGTDVYVDEFAHIANDNELWLVTRDFIILGGRQTLISTPMGKRGKFHEIMGPLQAVKHKEIDSFETIWSYHEIPYTRCPRLVLQDKLGILKADIDEIHFEQEYLCKPVEEATSFFPYSLLMPCVDQFERNKRELYLDGFKTDNIVYVGIDLAERKDETVIIVVEKIDKRFVIRHIKDLPGADYATVQIPYIAMINSAFNPMYIKVDEGGPGVGIVSELQARMGAKVVPYYLTSAVKEKMIVNLRMLFEDGRIEIPRDMKLVNQLQGMERTTTKSGMHTRYSGKSTGLDDYVIALSLAVYEEYSADGEVFIDAFTDPVIRKYSVEWKEIEQGKNKEEFKEEIVVF